jgi:hypothetical protein
VFFSLAAALDAKMSSLSVEQQAKIDKDAAKKEAKTEAKEEREEQKRKVCVYSSMRISQFIDIMAVPHYSLPKSLSSG